MDYSCAYKCFCFRAHDFDKNTMLDGLELMSAFAHNMEIQSDNDTELPNLENFTSKIFI